MEDESTHCDCRFAIERLTLDNGLRVVLLPDSRVPLIAIQMFYEAGARHEPAELSGLAHLCEHLAHAGPEERGYPELVRQMGGLANGTTSFDHTRYSHLVPSHQLAPALWLEARRLSGEWARVEPESLDVQRRVVLQERRQKVDSRPYGEAFERLHRMVYRSSSPYHRPPIGTPDGLHALTPETVEAFVDRYYTPGRAILVLAGGFAPDTARAEIERHLGPLRQSDDRRTADDRPEENGTAERRVVESRVPAARAHHGQRVEGHAQPGWYRAALAVSSLALGRSSPLQRELVAEREVAQRVDSTIISMRDASTIVFSATAAEGVEHRQLEDALDDSVDRLLRRGVSAEMLHRARRRQLAGHYLRVQRLNHRADLSARLTSYFDAPERFTSEDRRLLGVTVDDLGSYTADLARVPRASLSIVPAGEQP